MYSSGFIEPHAKKGEFYLGTPDFKKTFLRVLKRSGGWFIGVSVVQGLVSAETRPCATWRSRRLCARGRGRAQVTSACASAASPRPAASHHAGLPGGRRLSLADLCSVSSAGSCWKSHVCNTAGVTTDQRQLAPLIFYSGQRLPFPHNHKWKISQGLPVTVIRDVGVSIAVTVPRTLTSSGVMVTAKGSSSQLYLLPSALEAINERDLSNC